MYDLPECLKQMMEDCRQDLYRHGMISMPERLVNHVRVMQYAIIGRFLRDRYRSQKLDTFYHEIKLQDSLDKRHDRSFYVTLPSSMSNASNPMIRYSLTRRWYYKSALESFGIMVDPEMERGYTRPDLITICWYDPQSSVSKKRKRTVQQQQPSPSPLEKLVSKVMDVSKICLRSFEKHGEISFTPFLS